MASQLWLLKLYSGPKHAKDPVPPRPPALSAPSPRPRVARREFLRAGRPWPPWCPTSSSGRRGKRGSERGSCPHSPRTARARPEAAFQFPQKGLSSCRRFAWTRNSTHPGCQEFTPIAYWEARSALFRDFLHLFRSSRDTPYGDRAPLWMGEPREGGVRERHPREGAPPLVTTKAAPSLQRHWLPVALLLHALCTSGAFSQLTAGVRVTKKTLPPNRAP